MPFVKLDCGILDSSIWIDRPARELFITALLMAEPTVFDEPQEAIEVRSLKKTGFVVPPGCYGIVRAAGSGIVRRAGLNDIEEGMKALERLASPEDDSRSREWDGRRLVRVNGGFCALNFERYRKRDATAAERAKRYRDKQKEGSVTRDERDATRNVTPKSQKQKQKQKQKKDIICDKRIEAERRFEEHFWPAYPRRKPGEGKAEACKAFIARVVTDRISADLLIQKAAAYKRVCESEGKLRGNYVKLAASWLSPTKRGWEEDWEGALNSSSELPFLNEIPS
jgi:hypothetical protein